MTDVSFPEAGQKIQRYIDFKDDASIQDLFEGWDGILEPELGLGDIVSDGAVQLYIMEVFNHAATAESRVSHERVLNYEVEYILAGNESDSENLKTVLWKLLAFRCVMNLYPHVRRKRNSGRADGSPVVYSPIDSPVYRGCRLPAEMRLGLCGIPVGLPDIAEGRKGSADEG